MLYAVHSFCCCCCCCFFLTSANEFGASFSAPSTPSKSSLICSLFYYIPYIFMTFTWFNMNKNIFHTAWDDFKNVFFFCRRHRHHLSIFCCLSLLLAISRACNSLFSTVDTEKLHFSCAFIPCAARPHFPSSSFSCSFWSKSIFLPPSVPRSPTLATRRYAYITNVAAILEYFSSCAAVWLAHIYIRCTSTFYRMHTGTE